MFPEHIPPPKLAEHTFLVIAYIHLVRSEASRQPLVGALTMAHEEGTEIAEL